MLLTYEFYDRAEASAVRAIAGETPIGGRLPIALPGMFDRCAGLERRIPGDSLTDRASRPARRRPSPATLLT